MITHTKKHVGAELTNKLPVTGYMENNSRDDFLIQLLVCARRDGKDALHHAQRTALSEGKLSPIFQMKSLSLKCPRRAAHAGDSPASRGVRAQTSHRVWSLGVGGSRARPMDWCPDNNVDENEHETLATGATQTDKQKSKEYKNKSQRRKHTKDNGGRTHKKEKTRRHQSNVRHVDACTLIVDSVRTSTKSKGRA